MTTPIARTGFCRTLGCMVLLILCSLASAQAQAVRAAGANAGWTFYGVRLSNAGAGERWKDLSFSFVGNIPETKTPARGAQLKCEVFMNLRNASVTVKPNGEFEWPPTIGVLTPGTQVTVSEVKSFTTREGTHFWINLVKN
jgi:hypothetical protein